MAHNEFIPDAGKLVLSELTDAELLAHLDEVSAEIKRRNGLLPQTGASAMVDVLKAVRDLTQA